MKNTKKAKNHPLSMNLMFLSFDITYAAKSLQSYPTLCDPVDCSPPDSSGHGDSPGKNTRVGCHALLQGIFPTQGLNSITYISCIGRWVPTTKCHLGSLCYNMYIVFFPLTINFALYRFFDL